ncbi:MAG TPA: sugar phosphate isomerase/epimerase family protein [Ktedonobacteraceae bacterium]|nr:sugar phosphate isomerase/epimerase family protein [Ktedonobacteraceae bacterium]
MDRIQLLCSTGAFSRFPDITDHQSIIEYGPLLAVDGLEVMFFPGWTDNIEQIAGELRASGLRFPAIHAEKGSVPALISTQPAEREQGWRWLQASCRLGQQLQADVLVFHLWGLPDSDDRFADNLAILPDCFTMAEQHGLTLAIETIPCKSGDPLGNVRRAVEKDYRCHVALDTEFLALHQQLAAALDADWLWQDQRVRHIHIKDYDGAMYSTDNYRRYLHPGEGSIDFPHFFSALKARHYHGNISLEASVVNRDGTRDIEKLRQSLAQLKLFAY